MIKRSVVVVVSSDGLQRLDTDYVLVLFPAESGGLPCFSLFCLSVGPVLVRGGG